MTSNQTGGQTATAMLRTVYQAYNDRDFDRALDLVSEEYRGITVPFATEFRGRTGYRAYLDGWATAFPDSRVDVLRLMATEDGGAVEFVGRGTHTGPLHTPGGDIPASGAPIEIPFCEVFLIRGGKIVEVHTYFDSATMLRQIGATAAAIG